MFGVRGFYLGLAILDHRGGGQEGRELVWGDHHRKEKRVYWIGVSTRNTGTRANDSSDIFFPF